MNSESKFYNIRIVNFKDLKDKKKKRKEKEKKRKEKKRKNNNKQIKIY